MTTPQTSKKPNWFMQTLGSTIGRKLLMALTGLFLILFLTIHLIGNLQLLLPDGGKTFNEYAEFMGHNKLIQAVSFGNFFFIVLHIIVSIVLTFQNQGARPVQYAYKSKTKVTPAARQMMVLGTLILIFIVVHLVNFWGKAKFGEMPKTAEGLHDLYLVTKTAFESPILVGLYVFCMIALAFHLSHGFQSAFQTLGLNHKKYTPFIKTLGAIYSILIPVLYALIPIIMFMQFQMK
jgi:succinate dehydrogenase / fumarate reductase, cytochrome b subunit